MRNRGNFRRNLEPYRINSHIHALKVRLVGENVEPGIYDIKEALRIAETKQLDLVEISGKSDPPVCKILEYSKFKYDQKKKEKLLKNKSKKIVIKEIRFGPNTDDHDFDFKLRHAIKFLKEKAKLKVSLKFSGREIQYKDRGEVLLLRFAQALEEYGKVEHLPVFQDRKMTLMVVPKIIKNG